MHPDQCLRQKDICSDRKEAMAMTWACEKFSDYVLECDFLIEIDHKPLVPLLNTKQLDGLPPRVLRFRLRLARYKYKVEHVPGRDLYTADTLFRDPVAPNLRLKISHFRQK